MEMHKAINFGYLMRFFRIVQKQPFRVVLRKTCCKIRQRIYKRTPMPKCDFNKFATKICWHGCSVTLLCIFRTLFSKSTFEGLLPIV